MTFNSFRVTLLKVRGAAALPALLALLMMTARTAFAEFNTWSNIGAEGGTFNRILPDPQHPGTVYATGYAGIATIYKTTDGAQNWNAANSGLTSLFVTSLTLDPQDPHALCAGTLGDVFRITFNTPA